MLWNSETACRRMHFKQFFTISGFACYREREGSILFLFFYLEVEVEEVYFESLSDWSMQGPDAVPAPQVVLRVPRAYDVP